MTIEIETTDALTRVIDVVVLKYAQGFYGVDAAAADKIGGLPHLPEPGDHYTAPNPRGIGAHALVFLGVPSLWQFSYEEIREFGSRAIKVPADLGLRATEIGVTIHGVGYGLDESEAFRAELAGILGAVARGHSESTLRRVVVLESDPRRAERLRRVLKDVVSDLGNSEPDVGHEGGSRLPTRHTFDSAGFGSATHARAFVAMSFDESFYDRFHYGIAPPLRAAGLLCERMDTISFTGDIVRAMERRIRTADLVVADISTANPNVYLEIGYAWAARRPTLLLCHVDCSPAFNVRGHRCLKFSSIHDLEQKLAREISGLI